MLPVAERDETTAVKVIPWPTIEGLAGALNVTAAATGTTVCRTAAELQAGLFLSPA